MTPVRTLTVYTPALFGRVRAEASVAGESVSLATPMLHVGPDQPAILLSFSDLHRHGRLIGGVWRSLHAILSELALQEAHA